MNSTKTKLSEKALALLVSLVLAFSMVPIAALTAFAGEDDVSPSAETGEDTQGESVSHDLSDHITSLVVNGDPDSVSDGDPLTVKFGWIIEGEVHGGTDVFTYQLPVSFNIKSAATGDITKGTGGDAIGTYHVSTDGLVTIKYNSDYNTSSQTTVNYMEITGYAVYDPDDDEHVVEFKWKDSSKVIVVVSSGDFTVSKSAVRSYPDNKLGESSTIAYTVDIASEQGTNGNSFTITDTLKTANMGSGSSVEFDASSFSLTDGKGSSYSVSPVIDGKTFTIEDVPALAAGGKYTLSYNVNVQQSGYVGWNNTTSSWTATVTNTVKVASGDTTHEGSKTVNYSQIITKSMSSYSNVNKTIQWGVRIYTNGTNLAGLTFSDTADAALVFRNDKHTIVLNAYSSDGTKTGVTVPEVTHSDNNKTFSFVFPDVANVAYWGISYETAVGETVPTKNTATLIVGEKSWSSTAKYTIQGETTVSKSAQGHGDVGENGTVPFYWNNVINYDDRVTDFEHTDQIGAAGVYYYSGSKVSVDKSSYASKHYGTAKELYSTITDTLKITVKNSSGESVVLTYEEYLAAGGEVVFTFLDASGNAVTATNASTHVKTFKIQFKNVDNVKPQRIEYSYTTRFNTDRYAAGTKWVMFNTLSSNAVYNRDVQNPYIQELETVGGLEKQSWLWGELWSGQSGRTIDYDKKTDGTLKDESTRGTVTFRLLASPAEGQDYLHVTDQLPEGMSLVDGSVKVGSYKASENRSTYGWTNNENVSIAYNEETRLLTVDVKNLGTELKLQDKNTVVIYYKVKVAEDFENLADATVSKTSSGYVASKTFTNTATNGEVTSSLDTVITRDEEVLAKSGEQIQVLGANTRTVRYTVQVNPRALDLLEGGDELTLTDTMTSTALDFKLDPTSIKLTYADGTEAEPLGVKVEQPVSEGGTTQQVFTVTVKDATAYKLTYDFIVDKREDNTAATEGELSNTIELNGVSKSTDLTTAYGIFVRATSNHAGLQLVKVDSLNNTKFLEATFELQKYTGNGYEKVRDVVVSGEKGYTFDYYSANEVLEGNTLYRVVETKAPEGYALDETPFYFIIKGNIQEVRNGTIEATDLVIASDEEALAAAGAPEGLGINLLDPSSGSYFEIPNEAVSQVEVNKVWSDDDDRDGLRPDSVTVALYANGTATGITKQLSEDTQWSAVFENLPKADSDGKDILYTVVEEDVPEGYKASYEGDMASGFTITNTHEAETVSVAGSKTWNDTGDTSTARPESITIRLMADDTQVDSRTVTAEDRWAWSFTDLPRYRDQGTEIAYTIEEDAVDGYLAIVDGYNVTNTAITVRVSKVDITDGTELDGAHIQILDAQGNVVEEWDSTAGETKVVEGLSAGASYTLRETVAPEGYDLTADTAFTVAEDGTVTSTGTTTIDQDGNVVMLVEDAKTVVPDPEDEDGVQGESSDPEDDGDEEDEDGVKGESSSPSSSKLPQTGDILVGFAGVIVLVGIASGFGIFATRRRREE